ncbi:hypothetical protein R6Q57_020536 [Mikania cordata]
MAWGSVCALIVVFAAFTSTVTGNSEGDALYALRRSFNDPDNVLQSWDPNLVNPYTWFHITCDQDNHVIRIRPAGKYDTQNPKTLEPPLMQSEIKKLTALFPFAPSPSFSHQPPT